MMPRSALRLFLALPLALAAACGGPEEPEGSSGQGGSGGSAAGASGSGTAGSSTAGSSTAGSSTAGSGTAGSTAGSGTAGSTAGSGTAGSGTAGSAAGGAGSAGSTAGGSAGASGAGTGGTAGGGGTSNACAAASACSDTAGSCIPCALGAGGPCATLFQACQADTFCSLAYQNLASCGAGQSCAQVLYNNLGSSALMEDVQQCALCSTCATACGSSMAYLCDQCRQRPPQAGLDALSDEFDDGTFSGWTPSAATATSLAQTGENGGSFRIVPQSNVPWYEGTEGAYFYKPVTGDFMVTTRVLAHRWDMTSTLPSGTKYQMGGILVQSDADPAEWTLIAVGTSGPVNMPAVVTGVEGKFSSGNLTQYQTVPSATDLELRICVRGCTVRLLSRTPGTQAWTPVDGAAGLGVQSRAARPRLSTAGPLRVGMAAWSTIGPMDGFEAAFDYVRFAAPDDSCN